MRQWKHLYNKLNANTTPAEFKIIVHLCNRVDVLGRKYVFGQLYCYSNQRLGSALQCHQALSPLQVGDLLIRPCKICGGCQICVPRSIHSINQRCHIQSWLQSVYGVRSFSIKHNKWINNKWAVTSGESRGPIHSCNDCNTKECSSLAAEDKADGVVGFLSFCPNWLPLSFPAPTMQNAKQI